MERGLEAPRRQISEQVRLMTGSRRTKAAIRSRREPLLLLGPGVAVLALAFFLPVFQMLVLSVQVTGADGQISFGWDHFAKFFVDDYYLGVSIRTFRLAGLITLICFLIGFPLAYVMSRVGPRLRMLLILLVVLPLMTSVVIRTFGWLVILGNGGLLSDLLEVIGVTDRATRLMHTESGIVISMVQVLVPFMTLTILGVLQRIGSDLEQAARTMGAGFWRAIIGIILPLSLPGIVSGCLIVFALSISSFITPTLVGGVRLPVLAGSIYSSVTGSFDWNFAAAQSVLLLLATLVVIVPYAMLMRRRDTKAVR